MALSPVRLLMESSCSTQFYNKLASVNPKVCKYIGVKDLRDSTRLSCVRNVSTRRQSPHEYCVDMVRRYDYETFLCTLLLPKDIRAATFAIRAFNVEIAQVRDMISEKTIGEMRMQFWKDAIDKIIAGNPPHQPVALELAKILQSKQLSKHWLRRMVDSRKEYLSDKPFMDIHELEDYSERAISSAYYLILESMDAKNLQTDHVASHLGKAQGITNLIRGIPFNAKNSRIYLPSDLMIKHNLSQEDILRGRKVSSLRDLIHEVASAAHQHLEKAELLKQNLPRDSVIIFLPSLCLQSYLKSLEKTDFNVFHPKLQRRNAWLPFQLWLKKIRNN